MAVRGRTEAWPAKGHSEVTMILQTDLITIETSTQTRKLRPTDKMTSANVLVVVIQTGDQVIELTGGAAQDFYMIARMLTFDQGRTVD
jgi:hypothetical protein